IFRDLMKPSPFAGGGSPATALYPIFLGRQNRSSKGSAVSPRHAEADNGVTERRYEPDAKRGAADPRTLGVRPATYNAFSFIINIFYIFIIFISVNILTPLPGIAVHVEQPQAVWLQQPNRVHRRTRVAREPGVARQQCFVGTARPGRHRPRPASV